MDKCREAFEQKFPIPAHWIEFDEKRNKYYCPYVADAKASEYQEMWEVWQSRQAEVDQIKHEKSLQELEINQVAQANQEWQRQVEEKDKRIEELEKACISYKNQRDDNAQKLLVKSVHYSSIQEELAKLKDRLELAHHLATQSTWSSLKQLKKVVKALRGEHD